MLDIVRIFRDIEGIYISVGDQRTSGEQLANTPGARRGIIE